jgi:hypothetical protein
MPISHSVHENPRLQLCEAHHKFRFVGGESCEWCKAMELAKVVNRLRIHRMNEDYLLAFELAKEILKEAK